MVMVHTYGVFARMVQHRPMDEVITLACAALRRFAGGSVIALFLFGFSVWCGGSAALAEPLQLVVLGDSLSAGYGLEGKAAFPVRLEAALRARGYDVRIQNAGVSGDTASGGRERLDWAVGKGVKGVIVELGANDALRGIDPAITRAALDDIVTRLKARGIGIMLAGMVAPPNMGSDYATRFNTIYPDLAKKHDVLLDPFFLAGIAGDAKFNQRDGIHPTAEGIERIVTRILPLVERFVTSLGAVKS